MVALLLSLYFSLQSTSTVVAFIRFELFCQFCNAEIKKKLTWQQKKLPLDGWRRSGTEQVKPGPSSKQRERRLRTHPLQHTQEQEVEMKFFLAKGDKAEC